MARSAAAAADLHRQVAIGRRDVSAHRAQRRRHALHRPAREARVADQRRGAVAARPASAPGEQPRARAGVAAVERFAARAREAGALGPSPPPRTRKRAVRRRALDGAPSVATAPSPSRRTSWPGRSSVISASPVAIALNSSARCAIDLSDGSRNSPRSRAAARDGSADRWPGRAHAADPAAAFGASASRAAAVAASRRCAAREHAQDGREDLLALLGREHAALAGRRLLEECPLAAHVVAVVACSCACAGPRPRAGRAPR